MHLRLRQSHRPSIARYSCRPQIECDLGPQPLALLCPAAEPPQQFEPAVDSGRSQPVDVEQVP